MSYAELGRAWSTEQYRRIFLPRESNRRGPNGRNHTQRSFRPFVVRIYMCKTRSRTEEWIAPRIRKIGEMMSLHSILASYINAFFADAFARRPLTEWRDAEAMIIAELCFPELLADATELARLVRSLPQTLATIEGNARELNRPLGLPLHDDRTKKYASTL